MSLKDCQKLIKLLDAEDREIFNDQFRMATENELMSKAEAMTEAAEATMEYVLTARNAIARDATAAGGRVEQLSLENLVNPASYKPGEETAAKIFTMSADEFNTFLEEVAPTPKDKKPAPKDPPQPKAKTAEEEVERFIGDRKLTTKKPKRVTSKEIKEQLKKLGMSGYSSMSKDEAQRELMKWYEARRLAELPEPLGKTQTTNLVAGMYNRADSAIGVVVDWSGEPDITARRNLEAWIRYMGGATTRIKRPTYEGGKTDKGYHFTSLTQFEKFFKAYTGKDINERAFMGSEGEMSAVPLVPERSPATREFEEGEAVVPIAPHFNGLEGDVIIIGRDPYDNEPLYTVRFEDPETGDEFTEVFAPQELRSPDPEPPPSENATEALKNAAKHGVKGADEALTGLAELFGGKGKFNSGFTFDEEKYAKAKPHFKKSLEEFVAAGKSLKEFLQFIIENFGEQIKPYLRQFHQDITDDKITIRGVNDFQSTTSDAAETGRARQEQADQGDTADAGTEPATVPGAPDRRPAEEGGVPVDRIGLPVDSTVDAGEQADTGILGDAGEFRPATGVTGHKDNRRGTVAGTEGISAPTAGGRAARAAAESTRDRLNRKPTTDVWVQGDPQNITDSAPALFPEQADDVVFAEQRLFEQGARGVMFTNGTGTGKTLTGLGIIRRMVMQGKDNIIIVVPGEKVARDWIKTGKKPAFALDIKKLKDTKDAGTGVVVTTYANFADNDAIAKRDWDLVVHDEAHKLSENMAGKATNALNKSRAITGHPDGMLTYAESMEPELMGKIRRLQAERELIQITAVDLADHWGGGKAKSTTLTPDLRRIARSLQLPKAVSMTHEELLDAVDRFRIRVYNSIGGADRVMTRVEQISEELQPLTREFDRRAREIHFPNRKELWASNFPKRVDLTATPFAYEKSTDHAEGFLFEYDRSLDEKSRGYNEPDAQGAFMVEHFGYRMRYGKLTEPEAGVDRGLMQRQFNQWLKAQGALRGRVLTVDHDYSREFVAIDDLIGRKIDEGQQLIWDRARDKENPLQRGYELMSKALRKQFNYHARVRMLEAIKAPWAIERARKHMALGRKVVIFHSRIQGGTMNPFHIFAGVPSLPAEIEASEEERAQYMQAASGFASEREDLMTLNINTRRPLDLFADEFGDQLTLYNGTLTNKQKNENPDKFNNDDSDIQVIALQDDGGKEGISLHDATGKNQRVLINLGLPVKPTQAIQIEGRIYRVGQQSNAIFEYFNTGTNFERITFAEKISERASTAENLAMGEQARALRDSFVDAFEQPSFGDPSEAQGVGGQEVDRANWAATTEFELAKTHYFGTLKTKGKGNQRAGVDYYATPEPLGVKMVEWADMKANDTALEPSAGHGAIARYFPESVSATYVEPSQELLSRLMLRAPGSHRQMNFEDLDVGGNKYNAIVMNPPFRGPGGGALWHKHLQKAMHHLKNGGRIVALIPEGPAADKRFDALFYGKEGELEQLRETIKRKRREGGSIAEETRRIDELTNFHLRASIGLPSITFTRAGTGVKSRVVVIDKMIDSHADRINQSPREIFADTIQEVFDKIEDMTVPARTKLTLTPEEYLQREGLIILHDEPNGVWRISGKTYEHRMIIARALGENGQYDHRTTSWTSTIDPAEPLYQAMTAPQQAVESTPPPASQADINAAAAALFSGREGKIPSPGTGEVFKTAETKHAKKGIDLFVASFNERVGKDEYTRVLQIAKKHGGYYSAYKAKGAVPGFQFESAEARAAFMEEARQKPLALRDRRGHQPDRPRSTPADIRRYLKVPLKRISSRVPIKIVQSVEDIKTPYFLPADARGFFIDGNAYLVADNIRNQSESVVALTHEAVGHLGIEGVLGKKKLNELVGDITNMRVEEMLAPGTHPDYARIRDRLRQAYVDEAGKYTLSPRDEALEVIAHIAERKPRIGPLAEIYNKIVLWVREFLLKLGIGDPDMVKIEDALVRAVDFLKDPPAHYTGEGPDGFAAMRVYHVSDQEFDEFKVEKAVRSKGVGGMNYGFGHYFGSSEEVTTYFENLFELEGRERIYTYEADISPSPDEMLDWQGEYNRQSPTAQQALTILLEKPREYFEGVGITGGQAYRTAEREIKQGNQLGERIKNIARTSGMDVDAMQPDQVVSIALRQLGVRGVRYLERFNRKQMAYNFVVFTDEDVKTLSRKQKKPPAGRKPLAMRPPGWKDMSAEEKRRAEKLGLQGTPTMWERINELRTANISEAIDTAVGRGYEGLFDGLIELKRKELEAGVGLGANDYENSAYISARLATGISDMMTHILNYGPLRWLRGVSAHAGTWTDSQGAEHEFRGLLEVFSDLGINNLNDWLMWMGANRAQQLMAEGRERNLNDADIQAGLAKAEGKEELFTRIKEEYAAMNKQMLDFAEEAGLIDPVKRAEWESDWYVPFYRMSEDEIQAPRLKRGLSHQESGIRHLFGSPMPTSDLLENIITNWLKLTDASVKNHALRLMVDNFKDKADPEGMEYISSETMKFTKALVPRSEIRKRIVADRDFSREVADFLGLDMDTTIIDPATGEEREVNMLDLIHEVNKIPASGFEQLWAITKPKDPDVIQLKRNGKNEFWRVHVPGLLRAVGHISEQGSNSRGMRAGRWFKRLLTTGVTASPEFMLRNFIRDAVQAWVINPGDGFKFGVDSFKGMKQAIDEDPLYRAMMAAGASFQGGYVHGTDPEASAQIIRRELQKKGLTDSQIAAHQASIVNTPAKLKSVVQHYWQSYREIGDKVENANRIATMEKAVKAGKPMIQALFESKDLMDYSRRGNYAALIFFTDLLPFLNARMQGIDKLGRATGQRKKLVAMKLAKIIAFTALVALMNDDDDRYKELEDWEKDMYWHLFPFGEHIRIPKPFEIGMVATLFERAQRVWIHESQPSDKFLWSLQHNLMETMNVNYLMPQVVLPLVEVGFNRSFYFDSPIESLSDENVQSQERYNAFTSETAIGLGDTALAKWLGLSPKQIQHLWNGYTGTMGAYALKATDILISRPLGNHPEREETQAYEYPILRAVYQGQRVKGTQWATDFYDRMQEVREIHGTLNRYLEQGKRGKAREFRLEHKEKLKHRRSMERVQIQFSQLRDKRDRILRNDQLTPAQKYQQMQAVQMRINALAKKIEAQTRAAFAE